MTWKRLLILFFGLSFVCNLTLAATTHEIKGSVITNDGSIAVNQTVKLFKIEMAEQPSLVPLGEGKTDKNGNFVIPIPDHVEGTFYRVNTTIKDQLIGSRPLRFDPGETVIRIELRQPGMVAGIQNITFSKHLMVFDLLEDVIQVTELVNFENRTQSTVNTRGNPLVKRIPEQAVNFQMPRQAPGVDIVGTPGSVSIEFFVAPGANQLFFNYDLPVDGSSNLSFYNEPAPGVSSMELILSGSMLDATFQSVDKGTLGQITESKKFFNKQAFRSKMMRLSPSVNNVEIEISGIPMAQKKLFYPATILLVIMLAGLFWYLKGRSKEITNAA